jgi:cysteine desulfurase
LAKNTQGLPALTMERIYLDYNATAPLREAARAAMMPWFAIPANPSAAPSASPAGSILRSSRLSGG